MVKLINFAGAANKGRSPVAELLANAHLEKIGAAGEYLAISSGTAVDAIERREFSLDFMSSMVELACRRRDIYEPHDRQNLTSILISREESRIRPFYRTAVRIFEREEIQYRQEILDELKSTGVELKGRLKENSEQTVAHPDTVAVLSMGRENDQSIQRIHFAAGYLSAKVQPFLPGIGRVFEQAECQPVTIAVLSAYAYRDPSAEVPNAFGKDKQAYRAAIEILVRDIPLALDRLLKP